MWASLTLVRHADSLDVRRPWEERIQLPIPRSAYPISKIGEQQADMVGEYCTEYFLAFGGRFSSPALRAEQTLIRILRRLPETISPIRTDTRLDEKNMGESWLNVEDRVRNFLSYLQQEWVGADIIASTHTSVIVMVEKIHKRWDMDEFLCRWGQRQVWREFPDPCSLTIYTATTWEQGRSPYSITPWKGKIAEPID